MNSYIRYIFIYNRKEYVFFHLLGFFSFGFSGRFSSVCLIVPKTAVELGFFFSLAYVFEIFGCKGTDKFRIKCHTQRKFKSIYISYSK